MNDAWSHSDMGAMILDGDYKVELMHHQHRGLAFIGYTP